MTETAIVPVYQAFGQTCAQNQKWRISTAAEMTEIFDRWDSLVPQPVIDIAYSWGSQPEWSCPTLSSDTTLQDLFQNRFAG